VSLISQLE
jgi:FKBP12-rapamycin complex-associated protein